MRMVTHGCYGKAGIEAVISDFVDSLRIVIFSVRLYRSMHCSSDTDLKFTNSNGEVSDLLQSEMKVGLC